MGSAYFLCIVMSYAKLCFVLESIKTGIDTEYLQLGISGIPICSSAR